MKEPKLLARSAELARMANLCSTAETAKTYHDSLKADPSVWAALPLCGIQEYDEEISLELRNCACCGSTLAKKIPVTIPTPADCDSGAQKPPHAGT